MKNVLNKNKKIFFAITLLWAATAIAFRDLTNDELNSIKNLEQEINEWQIRKEKDKDSAKDQIHDAKVISNLAQQINEIKKRPLKEEESKKQAEFQSKRGAAQAEVQSQLEAAKARIKK